MWLLIDVTSAVAWTSYTSGNIDSVGGCISKREQGASQLCLMSLTFLIVQIKEGQSTILLPGEVYNLEQL